MKSYRRKDANTHDYVVRYVTPKTSDGINKVSVENATLSLDQIISGYLIGIDKDDHASKIIDIMIDGKKLSDADLARWNASIDEKISECDGGGAGGDAGGAAGGDAGGATGGDAGASIAAPANADAASGTSVVNVLGNCDHETSHDGYFGPGCFHVPSKAQVPCHRWEIGNGGSKRKKDKKGRDKKYAYEKGMKVVVDMLHERKMTRIELDDFYAALEDGIVEFDFIKKDGTLRHAKGTLDPELMPDENAIRKQYEDAGEDYDALMLKLKERKDYMPYFWDLDKGGYRQFHVSRFEGLTSQSAK